MTITFDAYLFDDALHAWRNLRTGRAIAGQIIQAEVEAHIQSAQNVMKTLTRQMFTGDIAVGDWQTAVAMELKDAHAAFAMLGAGGRANMTPEAWGRIGGTLGDEYRHLQTFAEAVAGGSQSEAQAIARIGQYGNAASQSYWREFAAGTPGADNPNLPLLTNRPRDGGTRCRGNCNCEIRVAADGVHWIMNPGEHCPDCQGLAGGGPYRLN